MNLELDLLDDPAPPVPSYLRRILPEESAETYYCAAKLLAHGGFANYFHPTIDRLQSFITLMDNQGETMYVGQASYDRAAVDEALEHNNKLAPNSAKSSRKKRRSQENSRQMRSFFFDIDCGPKKPFATQLDGVNALESFVATAKLPKPVVESSGNGLYARWVLTADIDVERWAVVGRKLKALAAHYEFEIDPVRTADSASVLRPVGARNRKDPAHPKTVEVMHDAPDVTFAEFTDRLTAALLAAKLPTQGLTPPKAFAGLNDSFAEGIGDNHPISDATKVAQHCLAVKRFKDAKGDVPEPFWYDMVGLLRHCVDGESVLQEWSSGHPDYTPAATAEKIEHHKESGAGPTSCEKIGSTDRTLCVGCPKSGKLKNPLSLGYEKSPDAPEVGTDQEKALIPRGYERTEAGVINDGVRFYPTDLFVCACSMDHTLGYEVMTIRHQMPVTKEYKEFKVRTALMMKPSDLLMSLADNHCFVAGADARKQMINYIGDYLVNLKAAKRLNDLHPQMGWSKDGDELVFVLGGEIFRRGEPPVKAGLARSAPAIAGAFTARGSVDAWRASTRYLAQPGMESLSFAFLAGAFGAPLMWFTGHSGAMVSLVGRSGLGKTMTGKWALSAYGDPDALTLQKDDTPASMIGRLGLYGSLPAYIDEISNMESGPLSDLVYRITQGRERNRLTQRGEEKNGRTTWKTLALCSTNHPLTDKLSALKADASAEINRLLEVQVHTPPEFTAAHCREIFQVFEANYGVAGRLFVQYLVDHQDEHREKLDKLIVELEKRSGALPEERFWIATAAITIYGGMIAKKLGLIEIDVAPVMTWTLRLIASQRSTKSDQVTSELDIVGQFLDRHAAGGLITGRDALTGMAALLREPRGPLVYRIMHDQSKLFVSRTALRTFLTENYGSYAGLKNELIRLGALLDSEKRVVMGKGTYFAGAATTCWEIDLTIPALGRQVMKLVDGGAAGPLKAVK